MSTMKTTLIGMEAFFNNMNKSIFDGLELPEGLSKDTLTDNIILECGEFETLYSDPYFMQQAIKTWSDREQATFERWINALSIEYAPLENYDRHEDWTDTLDSDSTSSSRGTLDTSNSGTVQNDVSAYDSTGYQPKDKTTSSDTIDTDTTDSTTGTLDNIGHHNGRVHGNIGVTTSQQMLEAELELGYWNIYSRITELFMKEFCIMVYV